MDVSKICIVTTRNIYDAPCLKKYQNLLSCGFDIIYWDRVGLEETCGADNYFRFDGILKPSSGKLSKIFFYIRFAIFANKILKQNHYEKLIVFPTQAAWLFLNTLKTEFKNKYILDIRDYAGEKSFLGKLTTAAVKNAEIPVVTSAAYKTFLPKCEYVVSHNIQEIDAEIIKQYRNHLTRERSKIVLSFIGSVRFINQQKKLIELFRSDDRFELRFIGRGSELLEEYVKTNNIRNVVLRGRFEQSELPRLYLETDIAINVYGNNTPYLDYALSNKLYSAAIMGMPILVSPQTYMAEIVQKYGFGLAINDNDPATPQKVFEFFNNLSQEVLFAGCDAFMKYVYADEKNFCEKVKKFIEDFGGRN